ncbi:MAG: hypothetical protein LBD29_00665 [Treponema sp.]|jgi:hypothetical protein|nr:hypothetical protein [Treponema sp.]
MGILEHVKVLESKVDKEIDFAKRIIEENVQLKEKDALNQKRIEVLESLLQAFKEEQNAIENGILSALNRLNQFEDAVEKKLSPASDDQNNSEQADSEQTEPGETPQPEGTGEASGREEGNSDQPQNVAE